MLQTAVPTLTSNRSIIVAITVAKMFFYRINGKQSSNNSNYNDISTNLYISNNSRNYNNGNNSVDSISRNTSSKKRNTSRGGATFESLHAAR